MVLIILAMLVCVVVAMAIVLYVAYPRRGENVPYAPWVGDAMNRGVSRLPTLDNQREQDHTHSR